MVVLTKINKWIILACFIALSVLIIWPQRIGNICSVSKNNSSSFSTAKRINYINSMENLAKLRSSIYPSTMKYNWLFLSSYSMYATMMDRHFYSQYYAAKRHPNINPILWGIGFSGYNKSLTLEDNIRHHFGSTGYFDVIYSLGDSSSVGLRSVSRYSPIMMRGHECWGYRCLLPIIDYNVSVFLQTYAYEIDLYHKSFSYNRIIAHSPHCAEPLIFYPPLVLNSDIPPVRDIDVLVVGARNHFVYPIRARLGQMIKDGIIKNGYVHDHPGYSLSNNSLEQTEEQTRIYAALLRRAKIVVVDSSRYSYALTKFSEVPLSGCLILGDIPAERENEFRSFIVQISMNMTDNEIVSIIDYWITHDSERETKAAIGQKLILTSYTWDHSLDLSLQALINYKQKQFGIVYNYPYTMKCVPIDNSGYESTISKWCATKLKSELYSVLCECNQTGGNHFDDELDLDHWKAKGCSINATNPQMYHIPNSLIDTCNSYEIISRMVSANSYSSLCYCPSLQTTWRASSICHVSNTALTISRYLACL